jgi:hypothetical protein
MDTKEAGRLGGLSRSTRKQEAARANGRKRRNGFTKIYDTTAAEILEQLAKPTEPRLLLALKETDAHSS